MTIPVTMTIADLRDSEAAHTMLANALTALRAEAPMLGHAYDPLIRSAIWDQIARAIDFDLLDWLAQAWTIVDTIRDLRNEPGRVEQPLESFPLTGSLHPVITITIGTKSFALPFTIAVTAQFGAILLTVDGGYIREIRAGRCDLSARIGYRDHPLGPALPIKSYDVPISHVFTTPGLKIPERPGVTGQGRGAIGAGISDQRLGK